MNNFISDVTNEDCMEGMGRYPDKYFDLAIVDPPYGIGQFNMENQVNKNKKKWHYNWNNTIPNINYFKELLRVSKEQIIWGANYYNCFNNKGGAIIWYKDVKHPNMSKCEIASYSRLKKVDFYRYDWSNTDKFNELRKTDIHPCQKPVALYKWLLQNYAKQGDKILDTHLGSGSSRIAAHEMGFDFTAFELDKEYFEEQEKRYKAHIAQLKLDLL
jgi:site-specific DNA-methyltransferase (adenine-specific)